uniref:Uncharacterized protein n=1 Tax=Rhizophora mucronata TaxID=61149 RepID=A0A2P2P5S8_RHIMU
MVVLADDDDGFLMLLLFLLSLFFIFYFFLFLVFVLPSEFPQFVPRRVSLSLTHIASVLIMG